MKIAEYKVLIFAVLLSTFIGYPEVSANTQVVVIRGHQQAGAVNNQVINELNETIKDMKYQLLCAQNEITRLQELNQSLTKSLSETEVKSQMTEKQKLVLDQDISIRNKQVEEITKQANLKLSAKNNEIIELKNQLCLYQKKADELSTQLAGLNIELNTIKQQYSSTNSQVQNIINNKDKRIQDLLNQVSILNSNPETGELKSQLLAYQQKVQDLSNQIIGLNNKLDKSKQQYSLETLQVNDIINSKDSEISLLKNKLALAEKQVQDSTDKITILNDNIKQLKYNLALIPKNQSGLNNTEINDLKAQLSAYKQKVQDLSSKLANSNSELNNYKQQYSQVNLEKYNLTEKDSQISLLKNKLSFVEKQYQDSTSQITALNNDIDKIKEIYSQALNRQKELENLISQANKRADDIISEKNAQIIKLKNNLAEKNSINAAAPAMPVINNNQKPVSDFNSIDNTKSAEDYFNIAKAYQSAKDYKESINNYKRAIAVDDSFGSAYKELGLVYAQTGDYKNACYILKKYLCYSNNPKEQDVISNFLANIEKFMK